MGKLIKHICLLILLLLPNGCSHFDDLNSDPDTPVISTAPMQATKQLVDMLYKGGGKDYFTDAMLNKQIAWGEIMENYQYNQFSRTGFWMYTGLTNCIKMVKLAEEKDKDVYTGLFLFIKAYQLFFASVSLGDIPYSEALKGEEGIRKPKYDTQKEVMLQILKDLDDAYLYFSKASRPFGGDIVFEGDPQQWQKATTALQLKILIYLSKKESDKDLDIKKRFVKILSDRPLMESNKDNMQLNYGLKSSQICPIHYKQNANFVYPMLSHMIVDTLKKYNDYRLFYYGKPSEAKIESGLEADDWDAYPSVDPSDSFDKIAASFSSRNFTGLNERYTHIEIGEPLIRLGYAEQNFIIAEACLRKWIDKDPVPYYHKAIRASMEFIVEHTPNDTSYHHGRPITEEYIKGYLENPAIQLLMRGDSFTNDLNKIMTQKYLASFLHFPWESYYEYRRTGFPEFPINPNTNRNTIPDKIPMRWMYDQREYDLNKEHVEEAVIRQFNGNDNVNELIWMLKD